MQSKKAPSIKSIYYLTLQALKNQPKLFIPFSIFVAVEAVFLFFIFLAPRMPLIKVFGPPIERFFGAGFLHYPANFFLLPKLASLSRTFLSVVLGSLTTGMAVAIVLDVYNKKAIKLSAKFISAVKKYVSLFIVVLLITVIFFYLSKLVTFSLNKFFNTGIGSKLFLNHRLLAGSISIGINLLIAIFTQALFIYAIPIIIIENERLLKSILKSVVLFFKLFLPTLVLIIVPIIFYLPVIILQYNTAFLINKVFPESVLILCYISTILSSLVIDLLITVSTAFLYLKNKENA